MSQHAQHVARRGSVLSKVKKYHFLSSAHPDDTESPGGSLHTQYYTHYN